MFGSSVLEVGLGLIFVYLMVSLVCTAANEALASFFAWRAKDLRAGVRNLLDGHDSATGEWVGRLYAHPLIQGLYRKGQIPSYIPSRTFALALTDLVLPGAGSRDSTAEELRAVVDASPCPNHIKQIFRLMIDEADRARAAGMALKLEGFLDLQKLDTLFNQTQQHLEIWFNHSMERVSGWYKRRLQACTIAVAVVVTVGLNVDSVLIARRLSRDSALRSVIVAQAEQMAQQPLPTAAAGTTPVEETSARAQLLKDRIQDLNTIGLPIGWPDQGDPGRGAGWWLLKLMGLLLTAGAASLGAPFWFDVLNKFMSVRSAGKAPEETPKAPKQLPLPALPGRPEGAAKPPGADK
jgi:hypothetical protein